MTDVIWALVASIWALVVWDTVRRWSFATATRTLKAELEALRAELGDAKLPARVEKLEKLTIALKTHAETTRAARPNPFLRKAPG
jgi:sensor domain CHASE-containing protein